ncbi:glycine--tRNA ligase [Plasmodium brasilianum]|uniref:Glycine--tRNA ligase n=1 Tax=Plasmodium brasilianum TaxID=5824 RepID=A0ACB9Y527_PLABR|nr:glycine--tRNA ligase [Plasmodium brasilianum]
MRFTGLVFLSMFFQGRTYSFISSSLNSKRIKFTYNTIGTYRIRKFAYVVPVSNFHDKKKKKKKKNYALFCKNINSSINANMSMGMSMNMNVSTNANSSVNRNVSSSVNSNVNSSIDETRTVEQQIEKYSQEISSLIERNESIKVLDNDEELKKEYRENEKLLEEKKNKLKSLYTVPSEPLKLVENRTKLENLIKRKFFYTNSFEIYGGASGLYDYGPSGCLLKSELENLWRYHFTFYDEMLEIRGSCITPYNVLKASGHVDRFTDLMIRDVVTKDCYRADKYLFEFLTNLMEEMKKGKEQRCDRVNEKREKADLDHYANKRDISSNDANKKDEECFHVQLAEIELILRKLDGMNQEEIKEIIKRYNVKSPLNNDLSDPFPFNLMFQTKIGPKGDEAGGAAGSDKDVGNEKGGAISSGKVVGDGYLNEEESHLSSIAFLRPETAQGIFVNFKKLLDYNGGKMPFGCAQIGLGFRNEISPRNGLLRVREFEMAEIEYFVNPNKKDHEKFDLFKHLMLPLYSRDNQLSSEAIIMKNISLEEAVKKGIIANEALGYFLARTYLFLLKCGINKDGIRFRQHLKTEIAHYANDCWDAEILTSYGYIEVVGHADRSAYDLKHHMKFTSANLYACEKYNEPVEVECVKIIPNKAKIGNKFRRDQNKIYICLNQKSNEDLLHIDDELNKHNKYILKVSTEQDERSVCFELTRDMISFQKFTKKVQEENFIPNVIEPSFGIGRLLFCILEHSFRIRIFTDDKEERYYLALPYRLAPIKCSILSISNNKSFLPFIKQVQMLLIEYNISSKIDNSSVSIGKKYARTDEIGIPFAVTIDFQTIRDKTITLRERNSMLQIRIDVSELVEIVNSLISQKKSWDEYVSKYGLFTQQILET